MCRRLARKSLACWASSARSGLTTLPYHHASLYTQCVRAVRCKLAAGSFTWNQSHSYALGARHAVIIEHALVSVVARECTLHARLDQKVGEETRSMATAGVRRKASGTRVSGGKKENGLVCSTGTPVELGTRSDQGHLRQRGELSAVRNAGLTRCHALPLVLPDCCAKLDAAWHGWQARQVIAHAVELTLPWEARECWRRAAGAWTPRLTGDMCCL
jgi:hypothetical protein